MADVEPGFEVEVASVVEFVRILKERDDELAGRQGYRASGNAVFVARMVYRRPSGYGFPLVRRYVVAAFAHENDRVSYTRTTSNAVELPETVTRVEARQREAYEEVWAEIGRGLEEAALDVPIREGFLRHPAGDGRG
jgi:hypothetical protein